MRIHLALGVLASALAAAGPFTSGEQSLLLLCVALVVAGEAANSALEAVVDLVSPGWSARARTAKDAAAGAVLALSAGSVVVLAAVLVPALPALRARAGLLWPAAAGALVAAVAALRLPAPVERRLVADVALAAAGLAGLAVLAWRAAAPSGVGAALFLLAVAAGGARLRRQDSGPDTLPRSS